MLNRNDFRGVMFTLMNKLDKKDFIIHYLQAFGSNSCYIKLDFGVGNSIRVSDHKGIDKYSYRFNLMLNIDKSYKKEGRFYYCLNDIDKLVNDVVKFKNDKKQKYGFKYFEYMLEAEKTKNEKKGFWQNCKSFNE